MQQRTSRTRLNSKSPMHGVRAESEFKKAMGGGWCMVEEGDTRDGLEHATQLDNSVQMQPARSVRPAFSSRAKGPPRSVRRRRSRPIGRNILRAGLRLWHGKGLLAQRCAMEPVLCCCALHCSCWTRLATFWSLLPHSSPPTTQHCTIRSRSTCGNEHNAEMQAVRCASGHAVSSHIHAPPRSVQRRGQQTTRPQNHMRRTVASKDPALHT